MNETISEHKKRATPLQELQYSRYKDFFSAELLDRVKVVQVERMPRPPFEDWNLHALDDFAYFNAAGLALDNFILIRPGHADIESLLFHELVHVVQWQVLGHARFVAMYGVWQLQRGYDAHPLENMAYQLQHSFDSHSLRFDVEPVARRRTQELASAFRRESFTNAIIDFAVNLIG